MLKRLTYSSVRPHDFSDEAVMRSIALPCRAGNTAHGVTSCLWFGPGVYVQVLEGEEAVVDALMKRIRKDPRHNDIRILSRSSAVLRLFDGWPLKLVSAVQRPGIADRAAAMRAEDWSGGRGGGGTETGRAEARQMEAAVDAAVDAAQQEDGYGAWADLSEHIVITPGHIAALSVREGESEAGEGQPCPGLRTRHACAIVGLLSELVAAEPIIYP